MAYKVLKYQRDRNGYKIALPDNKQPKTSYNDIKAAKAFIAKNKEDNIILEIEPIKQ